MNSFQGVGIWLKKYSRKSSFWLLLPVIVSITFFAISQTSPSLPSIPAISLAAEPLYAKGTRDKPTLTLALSVEYPTVGAQYTNDTYSSADEYVGYFDAESCYKYVNSPSETPATGLTTTDYKRFERYGAATNRTCSGQGFSGNFMNWATSSAIDILRLAMTGGDRYIDGSGLTILQRAVIREDMFNNSYFPSKRLSSGDVAGAVPNDLKGTYNGDIYVANCLNKIHFGTDLTGDCNNPGNNSNLGVTNGGTYNTKALTTTQRFFFARVRVCDTDSGGALIDTRKFNDENFCTRYPNGSYKPVGNLQKYSDRLRVSVFGYLNQDGTERYGGVLRAPMKYVGPKYYDANGSLVSGVNPNLEWEEDTGIFVKDPQKSTAEGISGAINYLNQFGRTGTPGAYKTNDPVSELYYEALRYLQGLPPTSGSTAATSPTYGMTTAQKDGFPVYETWTDPHAGGSKTKDYSCLRNNILTIADIGTHADKYIPGNSRTGDNDTSRSNSVAKNEPDFVYWTKVVGAFEANKSITYNYTVNGASTQPTTINPNSTTGNYRLYTEMYNSDSDNAATQNTGAGSAAYYIAGMAYWARNHDIRGTDWTGSNSGTDNEKQRPGMRVKTYSIDVNQNASSSNVDVRRKSQLFLAAKYGGFDDASGKGNPFYTKDSAGALVASNAVWDKSDINAFDPTSPGEARTHFLASGSRQLLKAIRDIFENIAQDGNSIAGGAISTQRLTSVGGYIYQAQFDAADWSGDLVSFPVTVDSATNEVTIADGKSQPAQWRAGAKLNAKIAADPTAATRRIFIGRATPNALGTAMEFKTLSSLENDLQTALKKATPTAAEDARAQDRINFIRGNRSLEGTVFRKRGNVLGDIINSGVAYSGAPSALISSTNYLSFYNTNKNRKKVLYVGANDGLLHAFNSADGEELFAYIPSWLGPKLPALANPTYNTGNHQSFMDGSPTVTEALVGSDWKTVLVAGTGGGGQGVFALDVTDPDAFGADKVMWEFTDRDDPDMGNVIGRPQILKFRTSAYNAKPAEYKWFAVIPSGVNNYVNDDYTSATGRPALFLLDLSKGATTPWALGSNYYKISLHYKGDDPSAPASTAPTGLANFTVTGGPNDEVALIYAGDLQGNVWKMDFSLLGFDAWKTGNSTPNTVTALDLLSPFTSSSRAIPLFIAKDGTTESAKIQPITMAPTLVRGPGGGVIVMFGTGKYLESTDNVVNSSTQVQSVYALLDNGGSLGKDTTSVIPGNGRLKEGSISSAGVVSVQTFSWGRPLTDGDTTQRAGWYFKFTNAGERQISGFGVFGNSVIFGSVIPPDAVVDACGSGTGYQYLINIATGTGTKEVSQVGLLGEPFVLEVGSGNLTVSDSTGRRIKTTTGQIILQGSSGLKAISAQPTDTSTVGRLSWRQINNYQDLKNAP